MDLLYVTCLSLLLYCNAAEINEDDVVYKDTVNGLKFEPMVSDWTSTTNVYHLQEDMNDDGGFLISTRYAIGSLSKHHEYSNIAGSSVTPSQIKYREAIGSSAIFGEISSFVQHNKSFVVAVDKINNCLRWINTDTNQTSTMVGLCRSGGISYGRFSNTLFNKPSQITRGGSASEYFLTEADGSRGIIRVIDIEAKYTSLLIDETDKPFRSPMGLVFINMTSTLYVTTSNDIYSVDVRSGKITSMASGVMGLKDGELASSEFVAENSCIVSITDDVLMTLSRNVDTGNTVRVINLKEQEVTSLELPSDQGSTDMHCLLHAPAEEKIYVGRDGGIGVISYTVSHGQRLSTGNKMASTMLLGLLSWCISAV